MPARLKFLVGSCKHFFVDIIIKLYYCQKGDILNSILEEMTYIIRNHIKKLELEGI